ncbi:TMEM62 [Cordylochernes scorpioides]|uniref:TMEM62 n=1 Tax=Cordylochernes scorpioides TaxID=51811 RepID=A0ABY6KGW6_9ARAC|nr:TMEM62 [Cordylochernes scorpioides]
MRLSRALREKWLQYANRYDKVILQHDNARPHAAAPVKTYLEMLNWEVLPHPPYSPDIAPSYYYLFQLIQHGHTWPGCDQHFPNYDELQHDLSGNWFKTHKPENLIMPLLGHVFVTIPQQKAYV